jgi:hypothetical protein
VNDGFAAAIFALRMSEFGPSAAIATRATQLFETALRVWPHPVGQNDPCPTMDISQGNSIVISPASIAHLQ